jgi:acetyl-CoA carboxylase alpha subunit
MTDRSELIEDEDGAPLPESVQKLFRGMIAEIDRLLDEVKDLEAYSNLRYKADRRGIKMWQEAAPGRELMRPDHADLVVFLLERIDTLEKDRDGKLSK